MNPDNYIAIRKQLVQHLKGGKAFIPVEQFIQKVPFPKTGIVPEGLPYSLYQQFYHLRVAQLDILDYCRNSSYRAPEWPDDYWPEQSTPENEAAWQALIDEYIRERDEFSQYILDPTNDLAEPFAANKNHNLLREILLVVEHTAYHTGQLYIIYRLLQSHDPASAGM